MQQVVNFLWICGLYIALSVTMAYLVAAYDPRRPKRPELKADDDEPSEKKAISREERVSFAISHFQLITIVWHIVFIYFSFSCRGFY
jgi:hypothetical protein